MNEKPTPAVIQAGILDIQVCVPKDWTDQQVKEFADREVPCGTANGWIIRREGDPALAGDPERVVCAERPDYVHIMLDA
jgi:hypothetical protein